MTIGTKIQILRHACNMTQKELAEKCDIAEITVKQYENDKFRPKPEQIEKLALALGVLPDEINTENFWRDSQRDIVFPMPNWLDTNISYQAIKKEKGKNREIAVKAVRKRNYQSDLLVDMIMLFLSMNPDGQGEAYKYIRDIADKENKYANR